CVSFNAATGDRDTAVALVAIDQLRACSSPDAVVVLERAVGDLPKADAPRAWHRAAHAIVSLASSDPGRAKLALPAVAAARTWQLRAYAAHAATLLKDQQTLEKLAT